MTNAREPDGAAGRSDRSVATDEATRDQAERIVLGAMMTSPAAVEKVADLLTSGDFYRPHHGVTYAYLTAMWAAGEPTDPVMLTRRLMADGALRDPLGAAYLVECQQAVPSVEMTGHYAGIVAEEAHRRRVAESGTALERAAEITDPDRRAAVVAQIVDGLDPGAADNHGWKPVDLGPYIRGEIVRPPPDVGICRTDGMRMLYRGLEHAVIGEMESGKSWYALQCAVAEMEAGHPVVYIHFEESDPTDTVERLLALDARPEWLTGLFAFLGPEKPASPAALAPLAARRPSLVVLDGVNEGMSLHGQAIREEDGAAAFRARCVKPFTKVGAAVLSLDHVVKDREARGRNALGTVHKGNGLSGSLIMLETADPFGRGMRGRSRAYVTKDRPGHLRRNGKPDDKTPGKTYVADLVVDDTREHYPGLVLALYPPRDDEDEDETKEEPVPAQSKITPAELEERVCDAVAELVEQGHPANTRNVRAKVAVSKEATAQSLASLVLAGRLIGTAGARNATLYSLPDESDTAPDSGPDEATGPGPAPPKGGGRDRSSGPVGPGPDETSQDQSVSRENADGTSEDQSGPVSVLSEHGTSQDQSSGPVVCDCGQPLSNAQSQQRGTCYGCHTNHLAQEAAA